MNCPKKGRDRAFPKSYLKNTYQKNNNKLVWFVPKVVKVDDEEPSNGLRDYVGLPQDKVINM